MSWDAQRFGNVTSDQVRAQEKPIPRAAHGADESIVTGRRERSTEAPDVHVDGPLDVDIPPQTRSSNCAAVHDPGV
jgi:hypothetical protein